MYRIKQNTMAGKRDYIREVISWITWLSVVFAISLFVNSFIVVNANVISGSMETTIMTDDRVLGLRLNYLFSAPQRGNIIVFVNPLDKYDAPFVKRIIGLPGDTVEIINGEVFINAAAEPLAENYLHEPMLGSFGPFEVPADNYFVMGDNRNSSYDSREWGYVPFDDIMGRIYIDLAPNFKLLK